MNDFPIIKSAPIKAEQRLPGHLAAILEKALSDNNQISDRELKQIQVNQAWQCFATGLAGIVIGATAYHVFLPFHPPIVIEKEKPVIVQQEKPIYLKDSCVAFCGN